MKFVPGCNCCGACRKYCIRLIGCGGQYFPGLFDGATVSFSGVTLDGSGAVSDGVDHVTITSAGTGYDSPATVSFSGGGGAGAAAAAVLTGTIASVSMVTGGTGYTTVPTVSTPGSGEVLVAHLTPTSVGSVTVTNPGTGYTSPPSVGFSGGGGSSAAAAAVLTATGIASVAVTNGGSGYATPPTVTIGDGFDATATATVTGGVVTAVTITDPGTSYTVAPPVTFSGGGGSGATGTAALVATDVQSITLTNPGTGYTAPVTVALTGGGGSGATATAALAGTSVASVSVTSGGSGQSDNATVTFSGGGGSGASARLLVSGATVNAVVVSDPGTGYTSPPTVSVTGATAGSGFAGTSVLAHYVCFGILPATVAGTYTATVTPPAAAPGNRFTSRTQSFSIPACSSNTLTIFDSIAMSGNVATGYACQTICEVPIADTLTATTAVGGLTVTRSGFNWVGCGMFPGGDATVVGTTCTAGGAGNTPLRVTLQTASTPSVKFESTICCIPASGATAVPHFRTDTTCASPLQATDTVTPVVVTSCWPVVFSVTCPATVAGCVSGGSSHTVAHPMGGTVTFTE